MQRTNRWLPEGRWGGVGVGTTWLGRLRGTNFLEVLGGLVAKDPALSLLWLRSWLWHGFNQCHERNQKRGTKFQLQNQSVIDMKGTV